MPHTSFALSARSLVIPPRREGHPPVLWSAASCHGSDLQTHGGTIVHISRQHPTRTSKRWGSLVLSALIGLFGLWPLSHAAEFTCGGGDVACLIQVMHTAHANGKANTITVAAGLYTLTAVDNDTDGPTGLPSVTGNLTLTGAGADTTIIARAADAPPFRLLHVAASGTLVLDGL